MTSRKVEGDALDVVGKTGEPLFRMRESFGLPRATVVVSGKITQEAVHDFIDELTSLALVSDNIAIDFTNTEFIAGGACDELVGIQQRYFDGREGRSLVLTGFSANVKTELTDMGLISMFTTEP